MQSSPVQMEAFEYIISKDFKLVSKAKWDLVSVSLKKDKDSTIGIHHIKEDKYFVFNAFLGAFIAKFKKPKTYPLALSAFVKEFDLDQTKFENAVHALFLDLVKKKIIVTYNANAPIEGKRTFFYKAGTSIGAYQISKRLNNHELLQVYAAKDAAKKVVIIKSFPTEVLNDQEVLFAQASLSREIKILSFFKEHPAINKIIEYDESSHYAVLEFFKGQSIRDLVYDKDFKISYKNKLHILGQLVDVMSFVHKRHYIHGDIHDNNILVDNKFQIQLIDFGLAIHVSETNLKTVRKGGIHVFLPPERIENNVFKYLSSNPTYQSDIYQIGIIMYILLYNKYPFKSKTWKLKTKKIMEGRLSYNKTTIYKEPIDAKLIEIIKKCLERDISVRYSNAVELANEWQSIQL